jgi:hypothetical protein
MMCFNKSFLSSMAVVGLSIAGLALQSTGAGASVDTGHAKVIVGSKTYKVSGGSCPSISRHYSLDFSGGGNGFAITGKVHGGKFTNAEIDLSIGVKLFQMSKDSGTANAKGGTFKGTTNIAPHSKMVGTFIC